MNSKKNSKEYIWKVSLGIGVISLILYYSLTCFLDISSSLNVKVFLVSVLFFMGCTLISLIIMLNNRIKNINGFIARKGVYIFFFTVAMVIWFLYGCYVNNKDVISSRYLRYRLPVPVYFLVLLVISGFLYASVLVVKNKRNSIRFVVAFALAFIQAVFLWTPNPFKDDFQASLFHMDAYTNSIINTYYSTPYEYYSSSIYGHYGLLYLIPVKALHMLGFNVWDSISMTISFLGGVSFLVEYWVINRLIKNDVVFLMSIVANAAISFQIYATQYYQILPHRVLFQALVIGGCTIVYSKPKSRLIRVVMWLVCYMSMIWNFETGIVVTLVWCIALLYTDKINGSIKLVTNLVGKAIALVACFFFGFFTVNIYNMIVGGNAISIQTYLYPLFNQSYVNELAEFQIKAPNSGFVLVIITFLSIIYLNVKGFFRRKLSEQQFIAVMGSIVGLGVMTYYVNRLISANGSIVGFSVIIACAYICDSLISSERDGIVINITRRLNIGFNNMIGFMYLIVLTGLMLAAVSSLPKTFINKYNTIWNTKSLNQFIEECDSKIPADAVAFGDSTPIFYAMMNRSTGIHLADMEDIEMNKEALDRLYSEISSLKHKYIVTTFNLYKGAYRDRYKLIDKLEYKDASKFDNYTYKIYERVD